MKNLLSLAFLLISIMATGQSDFTLIDHDYRFNRTRGFMATDSMIFYGQGTSAQVKMSNLCSMDTSGTIQRTIVHPNFRTGSIQFLNTSDNHFDALFYNLVDYDISTEGIVEVNYDSGTVITEFRNIPYFSFDDVNLSPTRDTLFLLNPQKEGKILVYDGNDEFIKRIDNFISNNFIKFFRLDSQNLFLYGQEDIVRVTADLEIEGILGLIDEIWHLTKSSDSTKFYIIAKYLIYEYDISTGDLNELFVHGYEDIETVLFENDKFVFKVSDDDFTYLVEATPDGSEIDTIFQSAENLVHIDLINEDLYYTEHYSRHPMGWGLFHKQNLLSPDTLNDCIDISIDDATIFNSESELQWTDTIQGGPILDFVHRTYQYTLEISNKGNIDIDSLDIYSSDYQYTFGPFEPFIKLREYNLEAGESRVIEGEISFTDDDFLSSLEFYIPGADHHLDCNMSDNTFTVSEILSSTSDKLESSNLLLYPNPASNTLHIEGLEKNQNFKIYMAHGSLIKTGETQQSIDLSDLTSGFYFLNIDGQSLKFVKQ